MVTNLQPIKVEIKIGGTYLVSTNYLADLSCRLAKRDSFYNYTCSTQDDVKELELLQKCGYEIKFL